MLAGLRSTTTFTGKQAVSVVKGVGEFVVGTATGMYELSKLAFDASGLRGSERRRQTWKMLKATGRLLLEDPGAVVRAFTDPIREDWQAGNYGEAIGRALGELASLGGPAALRAGKLTEVAAPRCTRPGHEPVERHPPHRRAVPVLAGPKRLLGVQSQLDGQHHPAES